MERSAAEEQPDTSHVPLGVRLRFGRAAVQVVARRAGIRLLHIKGDTLDAGIRRQPHIGSDVDVLVDPRRVKDMHARLVENGWRVYSTFLDGSPFGHAQTYHHPDWGFLDLHRRFPGIRVGDRRAFDTLWEGHGEHDAVGVRCAVPAVDGQVVLLMLNAARNLRDLGPEAQRVWQEQTQSDRERRIELVRTLGADVACAVTLGELETHRLRREYRLWKSISQGGSRAGEWWGRVLAARTPWEAVQTVARAPMANRSRLAHELGRDPEVRDIVKATARRLRGGASAILRGRRS